VFTASGTLVAVITEKAGKQEETLVEYGLPDGVLCLAMPLVWNYQSDHDRH